MNETGNPQGKVSEREHGWVAGFFDGEGTVALSIRPQAAKNGGPKVHPMAAMSGTDQASLDALIDILTRAGLAFHVSSHRPKGFTKAGRLYKEAWDIHIVGLKRAKRFLSWVLPVLHTKRERAELVLTYIEKRLLHTDFRQPITSDEWALALQVRQLNSKGHPITAPVTLNTSRPGASSEKLSANGRKGAEVRWGHRTLPSTTTC